MKVQKRSGQYEPVSFDKVLTRIQKACEYEPALSSIDPTIVAQRVCSRIYDGVSTRELDELTCEICMGELVDNLEYNTLATRIAISNHHKSTSDNFYDTMTKLYYNKTNEGEEYPLVSDTFMTFIEKYKDVLQKELDFNRDYLMDYFGFKTLEKSYLIKINEKTVERPQHLFMRVSVGIHLPQMKAPQGADEERSENKLEYNIPEETEKECLKLAIETYHLMSNKYFTHATPTLFNAGTNFPQMSSCYLLAMSDDSIIGIYDTLKETALISKWGGGIGLHLHNVRGKGSRIHSTNAYSTGIIPMVKVFNSTAKYVNQGGRRNGAFALYLEPWHADIFEFLDLRKNHGNEDERARDIFNALWIPDLFMKRVESNGKWSLFQPNEARELYNTYGSKFETAYERLESEKKYTKQVDARTLWNHIIDAQIETGTPYILFKDAANIKSNQKHLGTIGSSNLCTEIIEYSDSHETAVCNLVSLCLSNFVQGSVIDSNKKSDINLTNGMTVPAYNASRYSTGHTNSEFTFNYNALYEVTKVCVRNLNKVIDRNYYPTMNTRRSNYRHRPIGLGVQGLADVFTMMRIPFDSEKARELNEKIFAVIYYAALDMSNELAMLRRESLLKWYHKNNNLLDTWIADRIKTNNKHTIHWTWDNQYQNEVVFDEDFIGRENLNTLSLENINHRINESNLLGAYSSFVGSPMSEGKLQFDLWNKTPISLDGLGLPIEQGTHWNNLRERIMKYGLRNSLLVAPMPTASTSQIMGNNECFEPFTNNLYVRRTQAGDFILLNKYLFNELKTNGLWNRELREDIVRNRGSIQSLNVPQELKDIYKTVWEIKQKVLLDYSVDRGAYICQSQSLNIFMEEADPAKITKSLFYAWKNGLKTGQYYLRTKPIANAQQFTVKPKVSTTNVNNTFESVETKKKENNNKKEENITEELVCDRSNPHCTSCAL